MKKNNENKVVIIDGTSILTDAYYNTLPESVIKAKTEEEKEEAFKDLEKDSNGRYIGAIRGLFSVIFETVDILNPTHITIVWGTSRKSNIRKEIYPLYKSDSNTMDEPLREQFNTAKILLAPLVKQFTSNKYEAIDLAGTIADKLKDKAEINILARNTNYLQLADIANVYLKTSSAGRLIEEYELNADELPKGFFKYNESNIKYVKDLDAEDILHFNSLVGVPSSGIPGVKGVGATTALAIVKHFGTIDHLYEVLGNRSSEELIHVWKTIKVRNPYTKLMANKENAFISKSLLTINKDVYIDTNELENTNNTLTLEKVSKQLIKVGLLSPLYSEGVNSTLRASVFTDLLNVSGTVNVEPVISNKDSNFIALNCLDDIMTNDTLSTVSISDKDEDCYSIQINCDDDYEVDSNWEDEEYEDDRYYGCNEVYDNIDDGGVDCETEVILSRENKHQENTISQENITLLETIVIKKYKCNCCNNIFELRSDININFCVYCGTPREAKKEDNKVESLIDNLEDTGLKLQDIKINRNIESVMEYI